MYHSARLFIYILALIGAISFAVLLLFPHLVFSDQITELRSKISETNTKIQTLEVEIVQFQEELNKVAQERKSLQSTVRTLDISRRKLGTDIQVTENRIAATDLEIKKLQLEILEKELKIEKDIFAIGETIRRLDAIEQQSLIETLLAQDSLSGFWSSIASLQQFQAVLRVDIAKLRTLREDLLVNKGDFQGKRLDLLGFRTELGGQKRALDETRTEQNKLLAETKNQEENYQNIIGERERLREQFENELFSFESQLQIAIDPSSIPPAGKGILRWPVDNVFVTQYFGNTEFATQNPQVYSGRGHNGLDFRAAPGTKVRAALAGEVIGVGDTDRVCPNASFGRWIMIKHTNGISTLYAHLSVVTATIGETVRTGDVIGFSGNTGYSTGPHLHLGVYASQGVQISQLKSQACSGAVYTIPLADLDAYLNPLSYL